VLGGLRRHPSLGHVLGEVWVAQLCRADPEPHRSAAEPRCCRRGALGTMFS